MPGKQPVSRNPRAVDAAKRLRMLPAAIRRRIARLSRDVASKLLSRLIRKPVFADAVWKALCTDPLWTPGNNLAVGAEIMRRCRAIPDPHGANRYLPHRWRRIFVEIRTATSADIDWSSGPVFLNFGAGDRNPLALPLLAALAGAKRAIALEPGNIRGDVATVTLQETLWDALRDPSSYGLTAGDFARLRDVVDADALSQGDGLDRILSSGRLELLRTPGESAPFAPGAIDLVYSRSVLEHVLQIELVMARLVEALRPGGVMYHDVALDAHDAADPLALYYAERSDPEGGYAGLNGWRVSDYLALFRHLGCTVELMRAERLPPEHLDRRRLIARYADRTDDDLLTTRVTFLVRKPG